MTFKNTKEKIQIIEKNVLGLVGTLVAERFTVILYPIFCIIFL